MSARVDVYEDEDDAGEWRWRLVDGNGRIVADCSEGYDSRPNAVRALENVRSTFVEAMP